MRRLGPFIVCALLSSAGALIPSVAETRDRPGTPNQQQLMLCGTPGPSYRPVLCGKFVNTASESVRIEIETTRNGAPYALDTTAFSCTNVPAAFAAGGSAIPGGCYVPPSVLNKEFSYVFGTGGVDFGAQYCVRFRARRTSDSVVSEKWSNYACAQTPPLPPKPYRFDFDVTFYGNQTTAGIGTSGEKSATIPERLEVGITAPSVEAVAYDARIFSLGQSNPQAILTQYPLQYKIPPGQMTLSVEMCAYNFSGKTCVTKPFSLTTQTAIALPHAPAPVRIATAAPLRAPAVPRINDETYMADVDMPGADYSSKPISGTAIDCQNMCRADGKCLAWTWVKPGVQNPQAMCWLKNAVPPTHQNPNTISGIKAGSTVVR